MKSPRLIQLLAGFADGDAISSECLAMDRIFRDLGFATEIRVVDGRWSPTLSGLCSPLSTLSPAPDDILVYHYGIDSAATGVYLAATGRKILRYHNITPPEFFRGFDDATAAALHLARRRLPDIIAASSDCWAVSRFNATDLAAAGAASPVVFPLIMAPPGAVTEPPDPKTLAQFSTPPANNILFVGRIAPNKCLEELIEAFAWIKRGMDTSCRLIIAGSLHSARSYYAMLRLLVNDYGLDNVFFTDFVSPARLAACYASATVYACTSRHEGYCLPLIEAMQRGVPVVSRAVGGTPEAMGSSGVLYEDLSPAELGSLLHRACTDAPLRSEILESQQRRLAELATRRPAEELKTLLGPVLSRT